MYKGREERNKNIYTFFHYCRRTINMNSTMSIFNVRDEREGSIYQLLLTKQLP